MSEYLSYLPVLRRWLSEEQLVSFPPKFYVILCDSYGVDIEERQAGSYEQRAHIVDFLTGLDDNSKIREEPSSTHTFFGINAKLNDVALGVHKQWWMKIVDEYISEPPKVIPSVFLDSTLVLLTYVVSMKYGVKELFNKGIERDVPAYITNDQLTDVYWKLEADKTSTNILKRLTPNDEVECTALLSLCYGIDVRQLPSEYESRLQIFQYIQVDNSIIASLPMMTVCNANCYHWFPVVYYKLFQLRTLCDLQGINIDGMETKTDLELLLITNFNEYNFYPGKHPDSKEKYTLLSGADIHDDGKLLLSYGKLNDPSTLRCMYIDEIDAAWNEYGDSVNPLYPSDMASPESVSKLQQLTNNAFTERIKQIKLLKSKGYQLIEELKRQYNKSSHMEVCLYKLLKLAFYMRNWKGDSYPYPVKQRGDAEEGDQLYNVASHTSVLHADAYYSTVSGLPLIIYKDGKYRVSMDRSEGLTIEDRLRIVDEGKDIRSCLHLSSNWLICSAYYYLTMLEHKQPFDPNDLVILKE